MSDEASRLALASAMDLAARQPGQPWGAEAVVAAAVKLREFLTVDAPEPETLMWLRRHGEAINDLYDRVEALDKPGSSRTKRAATNTTPPNPEPVDF